jgi:hypothetical protein
VEKPVAPQRGRLSVEQNSFRAMPGFGSEQARLQAAGLIKPVQDGRIAAPLEHKPQNAAARSTDVAARGVSLTVRLARRRVSARDNAFHSLEAKGTGRWKAASWGV